ncbi:MAG: Ig-like domain-containing protein [Chitinophagaceae bacterium]|nr:Ig-like domain-containing protein [Chitinophagaceae bacterium]
MQVLKRNYLLFYFIATTVSFGCGKKSQTAPTPPVVPPPTFVLNSLEINKISVPIGTTSYSIPANAVVKLYFNAAVDKNSVTTASITLSENGITNVASAFSYEKNDSVVVISPNTGLKGLTRYFITANSSLQSAQKSKLGSDLNSPFITQIDSTDKFTQISDSALLDLVQKQTFKYFWDFAHPISGLARERNNGNNETVTTGGSGFGIMSIPVAINRNFITRAQGLARMQTIVAFLKDKAAKFHGAFPHWLNGTDGTTIPFSTKDDGADLVETSYLMAGLLTARQYFNGADLAETNLRADINTMWNAVEWSWFRQSNQNVLYWHWSPKYNWEMNQKIEGWNECLITYILAASGNTDSIPAIVYQNGFARNAAMINGNSYYGFTLPLGNANGGPLFMSQYSFLGINPNGLKDQYANYQTQVVNHTKINYSYCVANPRGNYGYSNLCWGLTASDIPNGYTASDPNNDVSVIAPTAAISSLPFTPAESMNAMKFFYYKLGDKIFKDYGFVDAFSLQNLWYASSALAIDQGPQIIMIENYRTQLVWNLLSSTPEVKRGMKRLGFTAPYL